jgi:hypothetical protein
MGLDTYLRFLMEVFSLLKRKPIIHSRNKIMSQLLSLPSSISDGHKLPSSRNTSGDSSASDAASLCNLIRRYFNIDQRKMCNGKGNMLTFNILYRYYSKSDTCNRLHCARSHGAVKNVVGHKHFIAVFTVNRHWINYRQRSMFLNSYLILSSNLSITSLGLKPKF